MLTLGSLFDGIGGWLLAAKHNGVKPIWSSEIEKFPLAVTAHHFPEVQQLGDITKIDGGKIPPVDIICAGSPCQDLSLAGLRKGLEGERSGLFVDAIRIVRQMRVSTGGVYPRFFVWENVPGAFSSNEGMDFRRVLELLTDSDIPMPRSGGWATAGVVRSRFCDVGWRVLDAQYFGVPQRRRRIWLIADFAEPWLRRPTLLFERKGLPGDIEQSCQEGQGIAGTAEESVGSTVCLRMRGGRDGGGKGALLSVDKSLTLAANTNDQVVFDNLSTVGGAKRTASVRKPCTRLQSQKSKSCTDNGNTRNDESYVGDGEYP